MDKIDEVLTRGVDKVYPDRKTVKQVLSRRKIRLYQGFDPSMPNLHLGNLVGLIKLKQFQDLGHQVIFLIGDFTGMIGDPTDKTTARKKLSRQQVLANAKKWRQQAGKILRFSGPNPAQIKFNSQWNDKISFKDLIDITANFTVQQMLERDFFTNRLKNNQPIYLHEFLYPIAQAIDCVEMAVDLEIGGSDQTFNMLIGRHLAKTLKKKEKYILTTKLLVDSNGQKVGKTTGNAIFLNTPPNQLYGGIMALPDQVTMLGFELLTTVNLNQVKQLSPMDLKKRLAREIVSLVHSPLKAKQAQAEFERVFQKRQLPQTAVKLEVNDDNIRIIDILKKIKSSSEAKRLIKNRAVEINQQTITDPNEIINLNQPKTLRVGKTGFYKLTSKK